MALNRHSMTILRKYIRGDVLSLGYPDVLLTPEECQEILGVTPTRMVDNGRRHGVRHLLPETEALFNLLNASFQCVDIVRARGIEHIVDLNRHTQLGEFDLVIDAGTTEHCFHVGQAILNAAGAVKPGGAIFHSPPMTMLNHGFYNFCPTLLHDFYTQNGWSVRTLAARDRLGAGDSVPIEPVNRFGAPQETALYCVAVRTTDAALILPRQGRYVKQGAL